MMVNDTKTQAETSPLRSWPVLVLLALFLVIIVRHAWLSDDAYITFRTVENFVNGYGLRWNPAERVQSYTHPLWMFLLSLGRVISGEVYWSSLILSLLVSMLSVILVMRYLVRDRLVAALLLLMMCLSRAFVDYTTSGLENPLTHLLLVCFFIVFFKKEKSKHHMLLLGLFMALGMVNRVDTALLYAPVLLYALLREKRWQTWLQGLIGGIPFLLWEIFSVVYYGFPFPNTAYAKLNPGLITQTELWTAGWGYVWNSLLADPITLGMLVVALVFTLLLKHYRHLPLLAGAYAYLLYCARVGGDFMSGRFMTAPYLIALIVLGQIVTAKQVRMRHGLLFLTLLAGLTTPFSPLWFGGTQAMHDHPTRWYRGSGINDERGNYYGNTGLLRALSVEGQWPNHDWALDGLHDAATKPDVVVKGSVGMYGYFVGPDTYVVDLLGLGDPLMARLPPNDPVWLIGHWGRRVPDGYVASLITGDNHIANPALAEYYDALRSIIRDPLFDTQRWQNIIRMNRGDYNALLESYASFSGTSFKPRFTVTNPGDQPYVYAYVWNHDTGSLVLLDDASQAGEQYTFGWDITVHGTTFVGQGMQELATLGAITDAGLLNVGVIFTPDANMQQLSKYEQRFWWRLAADETLNLVMPPLQYYSPAGAEGYWIEQEDDSTLRLSGW